MKVYAQLGRPPEADRRWLDFGCGCGRVARHLIGREARPRRPGSTTPESTSIAAQIDWAARHLPGRFEVIPTAPPTALAGGSFDLIFTISVFTHLDEAMQEAWLAELARLLRPGGLLLATTHAPEIARTSPGVTAAGARATRAAGLPLPSERRTVQRAVGIPLRGLPAGELVAPAPTPRLLSLRPRELSGHFRLGEGRTGPGRWELSSAGTFSRSRVSSPV